MKFITNQKILAEKVGCSEVHISNIKARKVGLSEEMTKRLSEETKISPYMWCAGPKSSLKKKLREFFDDQKLQKLINMKNN